MILLEEFDTEFGNIKIIRSQTDGTCTYYQDDCFHSQVNADGVSTCAYVHVMHSIVRQSGARNVLLIGCAGGTLATMLHRLGCAVTVVDINPLAFVLAQKHFQMPEEVTCVVDDGDAYLRKGEHTYDAIVVDAFDNDGVIPAQFMKKDFFVTAKKMLKPSGVVVMNVMIAHDMDMLADQVALNVEAAGFPVILFDWLGRRDRNVIVAAGGAVKNIQIVSAEKPAWIRKKVQSIIRRIPRKQAIRGN